MRMIVLSRLARDFAKALRMIWSLADPFNDLKIFNSLNERMIPENRNSFKKTLARVERIDRNEVYESRYRNQKLKSVPFASKISPLSEEKAHADYLS